MAAKKLIMNKNQYDRIKTITKESSCFAIAYEKVQQEFNLDRDNARRVTSAVYYDYKYLKVL